MADTDVEQEVFTKRERLEQQAFTRTEFCVRNRISLSHYAKLKRYGLAPCEMQSLNAIRITREAEREWQLARQQPQGEDEVRAERRLMSARNAGQLSALSPDHVSKKRRARGDHHEG